MTYNDGTGNLDYVVDDMNDEVVDDATPQLGGNLDANGNQIQMDSSTKMCLNGAACTKYIWCDGTAVEIVG